MFGFHANSISHLLGALLVGLIPTFAVAEQMQVTGVGAGDSLNVRSGPRQNARDIGDLSEGDVIDVKGVSADGRWSQIVYDGQVSWVASRYLRPVPAQTSTGAIGPNVVTGIAVDDSDGGLVIRADPDRNSERLGLLASGAQVHIIQLSRDGKWGMMALSDRVGWVHTSYLTPQSEIPSPQQGGTVAPDGGPLPAVFVVSGVGDGDQLWVRQSPRASADQIGGLPNGSVINVDAAAQGNWVQVTLNGQIGYVNARYLTRHTELSTQTVNGFPLGITCRGTEPFWTFTIAQERSTQFVSLIDGPDPMTSLVQTSPSISGGYPFDFIAGPYIGSLDSRSCSDGMSDISYTMQITFSRPDPNGGTTLYHGCCNPD